VVDNWVAQFGISGDTSVTKQWDGKLIQDDKQWLTKPTKFAKGFMSFAGGGPNSRNTQLFISLTNNNQLGDAPHEVLCLMAFDSLWRCFYCLCVGFPQKYICARVMYYDFVLMT
jgi:hypothetical protein